MTIHGKTLITLTSFCFAWGSLLLSEGFAADSEASRLSSVSYRGAVSSRNGLEIGGFDGVADQVIDIFKVHSLSGKEFAHIANRMNYISLSYEGSGGLLGLSSGYLISSDNQDNLMGSEPTDQFSAGNSYADGVINAYMGLDLAHSIALSDEVELGLQAGIVYFEDKFNHANDGTVSLLLMMPLEINNSVTISPKIHWARSFIDDVAAGKEASLKKEPPVENLGTFYGGVSISFSY